MISDTNDKNKYFAVFGDIHGRISLMYTLAILWQNESGVKLEGILQVGDMGAFPDLSKLDESTKRCADKDRDELGFHDFYNDTPKSRFYLTYQNSPPTYFIRGNHEDFSYLNAFLKPSPIDKWDKIWYIPDGQTIDLFQNIETVRILALGGLPLFMKSFREVNHHEASTENLFKKQM
jgi:hypothetical protein